jgi:hypothetical protein
MSGIEQQQKPSTMLEWSLAVLVATLLILALAGCSAGGDSSQLPDGEVIVSTPPDASATPASAGDFATAVKFTKLIHDDETKKAGQLVAPESAAARYVMHRQLMTKAEKIIGYAAEPETPKIDPDPATGAIKIKYDDEPKTKYTWKDFTFDQGKINGWTGKTGPVESVLWSRTTSDQSRGRKAELKSAYLSNSKALYAIVELSSSKATSWGNAEYIAKGDYRQAAFDESAGDLAAGKKTLAYFAFEDAKFGGVVHIPYYDEDGTSHGNWELELPIK